MYDWANSAFATTIMAAVLPVYYSKVAGSSLAPHVASSYWGYTNTAAMLSIALMAPILGAIADFKGAKLKFLSSFLAFGVLFTGLLFFIGQGDWLLASVFYMLGRIGFSGANVFYDSLLPHIAEKDEIDRVSAIGYAFGYLGGGLLLSANILMIMEPGWFGLADTEAGTRLSFITVAVWWAFFSLPLFRNISEPVSGAQNDKYRNPIQAGFQRLKVTLKEIKQYREIFRFLIAFWFYNDGIGTIIIMAVIFGTEVGIQQEHLIAAILVVQFVGIPFTLLFGKLAEKISSKTAIYVGLSVYTLLAIGGYFMATALHFWILALVVAMVQGGTQALSRSVFGAMTPRQKSAEFFGFFDVSQKFSGILGPALFGFVAQLTGSSRMSIAALIVFFIGGIMILRTVDIERGINAAHQT
jgi:UMF1 family MFS transporter